MNQGGDVALNQGRLAIGFQTELKALRLDDTRSELTGHVGFAVLVERHQFVHTEDVQFHVHLRAFCVTLQLGIHFKHIAVLSYDVALLFVGDLQFHLSLQQQA